MSAQWVVKFNGHTLKFMPNSGFRGAGSMKTWRKLFLTVEAREASVFSSEAEGWAAVREYGIKPLPLVTVESKL